MRLSSRSLPIARTGAGRRTGTAAVEAAFALMILTLLLLGTWEGSRIIEVEQILNNSAREGARQAASGQLTSAQVQQVVTNYLQDAGLPITDVVVTVQDLTNPGTDPTAATELDNLSVAVTIPFKDVRWSSALLVTNSSTLLSAQANWFSENSQAYPGSVTMPPGW
jgi:Flp pilus assembly protein TadG